MILAEVKVKDEDAWDYRLYNCSLSSFRAMANRRYVAVGRVAEIENIARDIACNLGWLQARKEEENGSPTER
mgnify:CR=1 FL=1